MPSNIVSGPDGEKAWGKAKAAVREQYPDLDPKKDSDRFYALTTTIYKSVCKSPKYDCSVGESDGWAALAELARPVAEEQMGREISGEKLEPGQMVVVATALGRSVTSGEVASVADDVVHIRLRAMGIDQTQAFPVSIYRFYKLDKAESDNLAEKRTTVDIGRTVPDDPEDSENTGPMPAKPDVGNPHPAIDIIRPHTAGDLRWASAIWDDIQHYGFYRAMTRHGLPAMKQAAILAQLEAGEMIHPGAPEPEWVQQAAR